LAARILASGRGGFWESVAFYQVEFTALQRAMSAVAAVDSAHIARSELRAALERLDVIAETRAAMRREASFFLYLFDEGLPLEGLPKFPSRSGSQHLRDRAALHDALADVVTATIAGAQDPLPALTALQARVEALPNSYPLTKLAVPRAGNNWQRALVIEAQRVSLLGL
jgi:hypothetical protein